MPGTMSKGDLKASLQEMLGDALAKFKTTTDDDGSISVERHLSAALEHYSRLRPRTKHTTITLVSGQANYAVPDKYMSLGTHSWGAKERRERKPWDSNYPRNLPEISLVDGEIYLDPAPDFTQIAYLGSSFPFKGYLIHVIDTTAADTTIPATDRTLFLVRALAASLQELAIKASTKPISIGGGATAVSMAKNGTPAALANEAMKLFYQMAGVAP